MSQIKRNKNKIKKHGTMTSILMISSVGTILKIIIKTIITE